jgi:hypothetical protein
MENRRTHGASLATRHPKDVLRFCAIALLAWVFVAGVSFAGSTMGTSIKTVPDFEKMKSLAGEWQGKSSDGHSATATYTLVSDNSALMERLAMGVESEMVTMYYPDGDHLMMTHYCSAHNQPRMRTKDATAEGKSIILDFVDATNLAALDAGHMRKLVVTFGDRDHFSQEWTWTDRGKDGVVAIQFERKK